MLSFMKGIICQALSGTWWIHVISGRGLWGADWLLSSSCTLCGTKMSEDHILNCRQTHLYRVMRHDAIVCWLYDHLVSHKKYTVIHEQKTWVEQAKANQKPDILLPDCNQAVDVGVVQPRALNSYYKK